MALQLGHGTIRPPSMRALGAGLVGGAVFGAADGVLSPGGACCFNPVGAGLLAGYVYLRKRSAADHGPYGAGAFVGLLAGLVGGVTSVIIRAILIGVGFIDVAAEVESMVRFGIGPGFAQDMMGAQGAALSIVIFVAFAAIGGLTSALFFRKKTGDGSGTRNADVADR